MKIKNKLGTSQPLEEGRKGKAEYRGHRRGLLQESRWRERDDGSDTLARARSRGILKETSLGLFSGNCGECRLLWRSMELKVASRYVYHWDPFRDAKWAARYTDKCGA